MLFEELGVDVPLLTFDTLSGPLTVKRAGSMGWRWTSGRSAAPHRDADGLAEALGATPLEVWAGAYLIAVMDTRRRCAA
jgi:hypothetical protein